MRLVVDHRVRELEAKDVILVEAIALKSVDYYRSLKRGFEVGEAQHHLFPRTLFPRNQAHSFEADERSEDVSHFSLGGI